MTGPIDHTFTADLFVDGSWEPLDVSEILGTVTTRRGYTEENAVKAAELTWTWRDDDQQYDPDNPEGAFYGLIGRNTPVRVAVDGNIDCTAEISTWEPDETDDFDPGPPIRGVRTMAISAGGLLRRISGWTTPTQSAMRQRISGYPNLAGYWHMEQGRDSTVLANGAPAGPPGYAHVGVTFGVDEKPDGAESAISVETGARFGGQFLTMNSSNGWQIAWSADLTECTLTGTYEPLFRWRTSNGYLWSWDVNNVAYRLTVYANDGTLLEDSTAGYGTGAEPQQWITFRMKVSASGGTVSAETAWYPQRGAVVGVTATFSGTVGRPTSWTGGTLEGARLSHLFCVSGILDDLLDDDSTRSFDGYADESTWDRFARLCTLFNISFNRIGVETGCTLMGPQPIATLWEHLKEIAATEDGMIFDARTALQIYFRTRRSRVNQTAALALTYPDHVASPFRKIIGNVGYGNTVTVSQLNGGDATAQLDDVESEVRRGVDVNVADEAYLPVLAGYWLNRYAVEGARFGSVTIDCDANPAIASSAATVQIGSLLTIDGYGFELIELIVIGVATTSYNDRRKIVYTTVPAAIAKAAVFDTARYDVAASTLAAGPLAGGAWSTTATALTVNVPGAAWSTTAEPYPLRIAGEVVTVTSAAAAAGGTQVLTVTRSTNGVVKQLPSGAAVHIDPPPRYRQ